MQNYKRCKDAHTQTHTHGTRHMQTKSYKCSIHCCMRISLQVTKPRFRIFMSVINMCFLVTSLICHVGYPIWLFCTHKHTCHALYAHEVYMYDLRVVYHTTHSTHTHTHTHTRTHAYNWMKEYTRVFSVFQGCALFSVIRSPALRRYVPVPTRMPDLT